MTHHPQIVETLSPQFPKAPMPATVANIRESVTPELGNTIAHSEDCGVADSTIGELK